MTHATTAYFIQVCDDDGDYLQERYANTSANQTLARQLAYRIIDAHKMFGGSISVGDVYALMRSDNFARVNVTRLATYANRATSPATVENIDTTQEYQVPSCVKNTTDVVLTFSEQQ